MGGYSGYIIDLLVQWPLTKWLCLVCFTVVSYPQLLLQIRPQSIYLASRKLCGFLFKIKYAMHGLFYFAMVKLTFWWYTYVFLWPFEKMFSFFNLNLTFKYPYLVHTAVAVLWCNDHYLLCYAWYIGWWRYSSGQGACWLSWHCSWQHHC